MCGITCVIAKTTLKAQLNVFDEMLYTGALRGWHSTGVFTKDGFHKKAVLPHWLMADNKYKELQTDYLKMGWNFMCGHHRQATIGKINDKNAHPFNHGDVTGVQNGTLRDLHLMPKHKKFEVDSDNAIFSINKLGIKDALTRFNGAYVFIWHNKKTDTLHMIRNTQRPFFLQKVGSAYYGASEEGMLKWILKRNKIAFNEADGFELEPMVEYIFEDGELTTRISRKGYEAPKKSYTTYGTGYTVSGNKGSTYNTTTKTSSANVGTIPTATTNTTAVSTTVKEDKSSRAATNNLLKEKTKVLQLDSEVDVVVERITQKGVYYCAEGYEVNTTENVMIYGLDKELKTNHVYKSKVIGAWLVANGDKKDLVISCAARPDGKAIELIGSFDEYHDGIEAKATEKDEVVYRCDWCTADVYASEKEAARKIAREEGYDHTNLCLDCCDAITTDYTNPIGGMV